jgi:hypothetical protein
MAARKPTVGNGHGDDRGARYEQYIAVTSGKGSEACDVRSGLPTYIFEAGSRLVSFCEGMDEYTGSPPGTRDHAILAVL